MSRDELGKWRRYWTIGYLAVALVMLSLSGAGTFRGRDLLPWVFGAAWALGGLTALAWHWRLRRPGRILLLAGTLAAALTPAAQVLFYRFDAWHTERLALTALAGRPAPPLAAEYVLNPSERLPTAGNELTVVNFWATWCPPCIAEIPMLQAFATRHSGEPLQVLGATAIYGSKPSKELAGIERFLAAHAVTYPNLVSADGKLQQAFHIRILPATILLDHGRVVAYRIGIQGTREVLAEAEMRLRRR